MKFEKILPKNWKYEMSSTAKQADLIEIKLIFGIDKSEFNIIDFLREASKKQLQPKLTFHHPLDKENPYHNADVTFNPFTCPNCKTRFRAEIKQIVKDTSN